MEDMARLALIEQNVRDSNKYSEILYELLRHIYVILENPHDYELRTMKNEVLEKVSKYEAFTDYLKYIGYKNAGEEYTYPKDQTLNNLRIAQAAIERKIYFCCGSVNRGQLLPSVNQGQVKKATLVPANILKTKNPLLLKIEALFNNMIKYEDEELQAMALEQIPLVTLQLRALDRLREHQRKLKTGETNGRDLPFDIALLLELMGWFKHSFFSWVDKLPCKYCGAPTVFNRTSEATSRGETVVLEWYKCTRCATGPAVFPRYNEPRNVLVSRRGRCGEWANCFTLLCRALGYDTRYVYDVTDHVWCEVFDYESNSWLHVDPCEGKLNTPLMYSHGWGKRLSYVIAVSRDDLQDVTWRYTTQHKDVLKRRSMCEERELIRSIVKLREHRQRQVSEARRRYLTKRALQELVQLMLEKEPSDYESHGRISGSKEWRTERGEIGAASHVFEFSDPGTCTIQYYTALDKYRVISDDKEQVPIKSWAAGVYEMKHVFRKVENDWNKVYLAREEGEETGAVSWKVCTGDDSACFDSLMLRPSSAQYEDGRVEWTVTFDDSEPTPVEPNDVTLVSRSFRAAVVRAVLCGGRGDVSWQHAQLCRQPLDSNTCALEIVATLRTRN